MDIDVRPATPDDLPAVLEATRRRRAQLAEWEPAFWRPAADADETHAAYLTALAEKGDEDATVRVVTAGGEVVGCLTAVRRDDRTVVDDVATVEDGWWSDAMVDLLRSVSARPAVLCTPRRDIRATGAADTVGLRLRSSYWIQELGAATTPSPGGIEPLAAPPEGLRPAPEHTFPDPLADGTATLLGDGADGALVLGPSMRPPPVYDVGGPVALVDRVSGDRRPDLLAAAAAAAAARGDVRLLVVCGDSDGRTEDALIDAGFHRVTDVRTWPRLAG